MDAAPRPTDGQTRREAPSEAVLPTGMDGVAAPGLQNQAGEYNCFLNAIIQCLWHCREFANCVAYLREGKRS
jgi:ubiquitin C-terminal hydrolase